MRIRREVTPFILAVLIGCGLLASLFDEWSLYSLIAIGGVGYLLFFFRDPDRMSPTGGNIVVSGADGMVSSVCTMNDVKHLNVSCVRISIFLSLFDVHVNRAPISGKSTFLGYFPGKRFFTFQEKSSELNQHNEILIAGERTSCLVCQIVGPVCRRVVYWPDHDRAADVALGERIGMMKFGSRLDMYLPAADVEVLVKPGDMVRAGLTIVARVKSKLGGENSSKGERK